jgi:hypothetical protein
MQRSLLDDAVEGWRGIPLASAPMKDSLVWIAWRAGVELKKAGWGSPTGVRILTLPLGREVGGVGALIQPVDGTPHLAIFLYSGETGLSKL